MSVKVTHKPPTVAPVEEIVLVDDLNDALSFVSSPSLGSARRLQARVQVATGHEAYVRVTPGDARRLADALYEWADADDAS